MDDILTNSSSGGDALHEDGSEYHAVIEGMLFASGEPLSLNRIAEALELAPARAKAIISGLAMLMDSSRRGGLLIREINGKYQLCTKPEIGARVARLFELRQKHGLSQAAYETLSIIAYNVNTTKALIEKLRGVNSDSAVERLLERGLVVEKGRLRMPGRPMAYDVTDEFYRSFGFKSKKDLPDFSGDADAGGGIDPGTDAAGQPTAEPQQLVFEDSMPT